MTSLRNPSTDVPATSDELEEERHLETNKEVARQVIDRIFVRGEDAAIDELIDPEFTPHTFGPMPAGRDGLREGMRRAHAGVTEPEFTIHDMIAEDDRVAVRLTTSARHTGQFMGMAPSGRRYAIDEFHVFRIGKGQVLEHWHAFDRADLMRQLSGRPEPGDRDGRDEWDAD